MNRFELIEIPSLHNSFAESVRHGLSQHPKVLSPRFFYDKNGSELFVKICDLPEYYLTKTETDILNRHAKELPRSISSIIELGGGYSLKTKILLDIFSRGRINYIPIDISRNALEEGSKSLLEKYPLLNITGYVAEFECAFDLISRHKSAPALVLFLGSNIGNLAPQDSQRFFQSLRTSLHHEGYVLVGFDLIKDISSLEAAYNDSQGVTAKFNLNILERINHELGGEFNLNNFSHRAFFNSNHGRIEMHLVSNCVQEVFIGALDMKIHFDLNETIHTENSYKFTDEQIKRLASQSGFTIKHNWEDDKNWFSVVLLTPQVTVL